MNFLISIVVIVLLTSVVATDKALAIGAPDQPDQLPATSPLPLTPFPGTTPAAKVTTPIVAGINMTIILKGEDGLPIKDQYVQKPGDNNCEHCPDLTLGHAASHALLYSYPDEKDLPGEQKFARYELANKVKENPNIVLSATEILTLKTLINKMYNALVVGDAFKILEPNVGPPALSVPGK